MKDVYYVNRVFLNFIKYIYFNELIEVSFTRQTLYYCVVLSMVRTELNTILYPHVSTPTQDIVFLREGRIRCDYLPRVSHVLYYENCWLKTSYFPEKKGRTTD